MKTLQLQIILKQDSISKSASQHLSFYPDENVPQQSQFILLKLFEMCMRNINNSNIIDF